MDLGRFCACLWILPALSVAIQTNELYQHGNERMTLNKGDDVNSEHIDLHPFHFFGNSYSDMHVSMFSL